MNSVNSGNPMNSMNSMNPVNSMNSMNSMNSGNPMNSLPSNCPTLTITSYNMLADVYCRPEMYSRCPLEALSWEYRRNRLAKQVEARDSGLFCFQEVEKGQFESFWVPEMKKRGYAG